MEAALYDPEWGFYATGGRAGRRGDFITSVEVGPLFGAVVARALDTWWHELGSPRPYVVVDAGAGVGTLARAVLAAAPECAAALRYVLVERSATLRAEHDRGLPVVLPMHAFAAAHEPDDEDEQPARLLPDGPLVVSLESLPPTGAHVVLANELLDNLPVRLLERTAEGWAEVGVGSDFEELLLPIELPPALADVEASPGSRVAWQEGAARWLREALELAPRVVVFDYMTTTAQMAARPSTEWLRTYRGHDRGGSPLERPRGARHHVRGRARSARRGASAVRGARPEVVPRRAWCRRAGGRRPNRLGAGRGPRGPRSVARSQSDT